MTSDAMGDRFKAYENAWRPTMPRRLPVIIRVDGRAFHTFTRGMNKPFDETFINAMSDTTIELCKRLSGAKMAFVQSDEISVLLTNDDTLNTEPAFNNEVVKLSSLAAALATVHFNIEIPYEWSRSAPHFDGRAFVVPPTEVNNYFIWRQKDWNRNSLQMLARAHFSQKELHAKGREQMHEMLHTKNINWNDLHPRLKNGSVVHKLGDKWVAEAAPTFTVDRDFITNCMKPKMTIGRCLFCQAPAHDGPRYPEPLDARDCCAQCEHPVATLK